MLVAPWCGDANTGEAGQLLPPAGQSLLPQHLACIRPGMPTNVLAHELGHVIMNDKSHHSDASCAAAKTAIDQNVMCPAAGAGRALDTRLQCGYARQHLAATKLLGYFPGQK